MFHFIPQNFVSNPFRTTALIHMAGNHEAIADEFMVSMLMCKQWVFHVFHWSMF